MIAIAPRLKLHMRGIRPAARLRHGERRDDFSAADGWKKLSLLTIVAVARHDRADQGGQQQNVGGIEVAARNFFVRNSQRNVIEPGAPVTRVGHRCQHPQLSELSHQRGRQVFVTIARLIERKQFAPGEIAQSRLQKLLFRRESKVHKVPSHSEPLAGSVETGGVWGADSARSCCKPAPPAAGFGTTIVPGVSDPTAPASRSPRLLSIWRDRRRSCRAISGLLARCRPGSRRCRVAAGESARDGRTASIRPIPPRIRPSPRRSSVAPLACRTTPSTQKITTPRIDLPACIRSNASLMRSRGIVCVIRSSILILPSMYQSTIFGTSRRPRAPPNAVPFQVRPVTS